MVLGRHGRTRIDLVTTQAAACVFRQGQLPASGGLGNRTPVRFLMPTNIVTAIPLPVQVFAPASSSSSPLLHRTSAARVQLGYSYTRQKLSRAVWPSVPPTAPADQHGLRADKESFLDSRFWNRHQKGNGRSGAALFGRSFCRHIRPHLSSARARVRPRERQF